MRILKSLTAIIITAILGLSFFVFLQNYYGTEIIYGNFPEIKVKKAEEIKVYAVGDIMLDRGVEYYNKDFSKIISKELYDYLSKADILFGNLESQISDKGNKIGTINSFRANPESLEVLKGFDIVSLANNHGFDYNTAAYLDSMERLKKAGIEYVGAGKNREEAYALKTFNIKGVKIGFLAFCSIGAEGWDAKQDSPGMAFVSEDDLEEAKEVIRNAKKEVDLLFVSSHAGTEYVEEPDALQKKFYQAYVEAGADVIIGHHPHVPEPLVGNIEYSLGNFVFDQGFSKETMTGKILEITIKNKKVYKLEERYIEMNSKFQPNLK